MKRRARVTLRPIATSDLDAVASLISATIDWAYAGVYPVRAIDYFRRLHSRDGILARVGKGVVLVAERDGEIVGTGSLVGDEIGGVFVRTEVQGEGIGTLIMDELETRACSAGHRSVSLSVSLPSRGFYEQRGYSMSELLSGDMGEGQSLDYWVGRKSITTPEPAEPADATRETPA